MVLYLEAVQAGGPVPAELIEGFNDGKARQPNTALGGTIVPHARLAFQEFAQVIHMGPRFVGGLLSQCGILLGDKGELQIREMVLDGALRLWRHLQGVVFSQDSRQLLLQMDVERALGVFAIRDGKLVDTGTRIALAAGPVSIRSMPR